MEKTLKLDELIAKVLINNTFNVITNVPGFGGTQVFDHLKKLSPTTSSLCLNEEASLSISTGAAIYGARSATLVKTHGLAKMANALCSTLSVGTNAANLIFAFDDTLGKSSDNIFDALKLIKGIEVPFVVLGKDPETEIMAAIIRSEKIKLPVVVYVDCEIINNSYPYKNEILPLIEFKFSKNPLQYVACPPLSKSLREIF